MDLTQLEEEARSLRDKQARLAAIEDEIQHIITDLRVAPKRTARQDRFAKLTGQAEGGADKLAALEAKKDALAKERETLSEEVDELNTSLILNFTSDDLTVPLSGEPHKTGNFWVFGFRDGATFPHSIGFLGDTLGLGQVLALEGTLLDKSGVRVPIEFDMDEAEAMDKVVNAFEQVKNALKLKAPKSGW